MAIDTKAKRASAIGVTLIALATLPPPTGVDTKYVRMHLAYNYALEITAFIVYSAVYTYDIGAVEQTYDIGSSVQTYIVGAVEQTYDIRRQ